MLRLGLYGGSFDPIHHGHLILARQALEDLSLDRVIFIPAAESPFKPNHSGASAADRLAMVALAVQDEPAFFVDPVELEREAPSYTIDTARTYHAQHPDDILFFLVGEDHVAALAQVERVRGIESPGAVRNSQPLRPALEGEISGGPTSVRSVVD